jgi:Holliday junction resolvase RusA-like endonuclease
LRRHDLDNAASSVMDALTAAQIIEDDNVNFVDCLQLQYGGHDKINPRVEIYLDD